MCNPLEPKLFRSGPHGPIHGLTGIEVANIGGYIVWIIVCLVTPKHVAEILGVHSIVPVYLLAAMAMAMVTLLLIAWMLHQALTTQVVLVLSAIFWCFTGARFVADGYQVVAVGMQFVMAAGSLRSAFA